MQEGVHCSFAPGGTLVENCTARTKCAKDFETALWVSHFFVQNGVWHGNLSTTMIKRAYKRLAKAITLQNRSLVKNHLFLPVLNFSSMSPLVACTRRTQLNFCTHIFGAKRSVPRSSTLLLGDHSCTYPNGFGNPFTSLIIPFSRGRSLT